MVSKIRNNYGEDEIIKSWVETEGEYDHSWIILQIGSKNKKPPTAFKFNSTWLEDQEFCDIVRTEWHSFDATQWSSAYSHFAAK